MSKNYEKRLAIRKELKNIELDTYTIFKVKALIDMLITEKRCPHCGRPLLLSDLEQYDYVCSECDENFFECEVDD